MSIEAMRNCCTKVVQCLDRNKESLTVLTLAGSVSAAVAGAVLLNPNYPGQACFQAACLMVSQAALISSRSVRCFGSKLKAAAFLVTQAAFGAGYGCAVTAVSSQIFRGWIATGGFVVGITIPNVGCKRVPREEMNDSMTRPMISLDFPT